MAITPRFAPGGQLGPLWRTAQVFGLLLTVILLAGLWLYPDTSLRILWYAVIPVLPAVFLVQPALWRNVCPLATLNLLPGKRSRGLRLDGRIARSAMLVGFALLLLLVPARRFVFNVDGPVLALVIGAVALLALTLGFVFDRKAGFCNSFCPVLPVEKLYGQGPLVHVDNVRCADCSLCTARGCIDLAPRKAVRQAMRLRGDDPRAWILTGYGAFAAGFPGFVVAYYLIPDTTWAHAGSVYLTIALGSAISFVAVAALAFLLRPAARQALPVLGGVTLVLYYWFGATSIATQWQLGPHVVVVLRVLAVALVAYWIVRRFNGSPVVPEVARVRGN